MAATRNYLSCFTHDHTKHPFRFAFARREPQKESKHESPVQEAALRYPRWPLFVLFTTVQDTLFSLQAVDRLTSELGASIQLLVPNRTENSPIFDTLLPLAEFTARYFLTMVPHASGFHIELTRYSVPTEDLEKVIRSRSLLVLTGSMGRFWPSVEQRLARKLQQTGHEVIFLTKQSHRSYRLIPFPAEQESSKKKSPSHRWKFSPSSSFWPFRRQA